MTQPIYDDGEEVVIFRPWFRHYRTGRLIFAPPGKPFAFRIRRGKR